LARGLTKSDFVKWVLEPSAMKPGATMPALSPLLPEAERRAIAESIYKFLSQVPLDGALRDAPATPRQAN
jgi:hypothetical protein